LHKSFCDLTEPTFFWTLSYFLKTVFLGAKSAI
jgi:hypothetical protein